MCKGEVVAYPKQDTHYIRTTVKPKQCKAFLLRPLAHSTCADAGVAIGKVYFVNIRIASSSPLRVSGYMRCCISC